jgi:hypothetical protein
LELHRTLEQIQYEDTIDQLLEIDKLGRSASGILILISFLIFISVTDILLLGTYRAGPLICIFNLVFLIMLLISLFYCLLIFKPIDRVRFSNYIKISFIFLLIPFLYLTNIILTFVYAALFDDYLVPVSDPSGDIYLESAQHIVVPIFISIFWYLIIFFLVWCVVRKSGLLKKLPVSQPIYPPFWW